MRGIIIGGGPAGASAALGLLRCGFHVTLYEQRPQWTERVCGAFLSPEATRHLEWLGVMDSIRAAGAPVANVLVTDSKGRRTVLSMEQKGEAIACPRRDLEKILLDAVRAHGGDVRLGERITTQTNAADVTVLATGRGSLPAEAPRRRRLWGAKAGWYGWNARFENADQKPGDMTLALYPGGYVGTLTFNDGTTNVCGLIKRSSVEPLVWENILSEARRKLPSLDQMLGNAQRTGEWRGVGPLPFSLTMRPGDEIRAGDAAAVGDPYMGEGIGRALAAGPMIAAAWERVKNGARTLENFRLEYRKLWQNHYATRLHFGLWSRRLLGSPFLFDPTMRLLIHSRLLQSFLPIFHGGFHNGRRHTRPDVSYSQL